MTSFLAWILYRWIRCLQYFTLSWPASVVWTLAGHIVQLVREFCLSFFTLSFICICNRIAPTLLRVCVISCMIQELGGDSKGGSGIPVWHCCFCSWDCEVLMIMQRQWCIFVQLQGILWCFCVFHVRRWKVLIWQWRGTKTLWSSTSVAAESSLTQFLGKIQVTATSGKCAP